jgi:hypothetical protein
MTTQTFGEIDWSADLNLGRSTNQDNNSPGKDVWLRLKEGSNPIRILTRPHQYQTHPQIKQEGAPGFGQKVGCCKESGSDVVCPLCAEGYYTQSRFLLGVIDRRENAFRILDVNRMVIEQLRTYNKTAWGDPTTYEVDMFMDKKAKTPGEYYKIVPIEKKPLSATDQLIRDQADLDYLKRRVQPPSLEVVQKRLEKIVGSGKLAAPPAPKASTKATVKTGVAKSAPAPISASDLDEIDQLFSDAEENN